MPQCFFINSAFFFYDFLFFNVPLNVPWIYSSNFMTKSFFRWIFLSIRNYVINFTFEECIPLRFTSSCLCPEMTFTVWLVCSFRQLLTFVNENCKIKGSQLNDEWRNWKSTKVNRKSLNLYYTVNWLWQIVIEHFAVNK